MVSLRHYFRVVAQKNIKNAVANLKKQKIMCKTDNERSLNSVSFSD